MTGLLPAKRLNLLAHKEGRYNLCGSGGVGVFRDDGHRLARADGYPDGTVAGVAFAYPNFTTWADGTRTRDHLTPR
jgi:hypothetical protein